MKKSNRCMICQTDNYTTRKLSKIELVTLKNLEYYCTADDILCHNCVYSHDDYVKHLRDHESGNYWCVCPLGCGEFLKSEQLDDHFIKFESCESISDKVK